MKALRIYAGPRARAVMASQGLRPGHIGTVAGAAGGPKGLILGPLDRFIFGPWLAGSAQTIDLVGASIGAWRMAAACMADPVRALLRLEHDYIHQHYEPPAGHTRVTAEQVSRVFAQNLEAFFGAHTRQLLGHPRWRLHIMTSHGRHVLRTEHPLRTPLGYAGAFVSNLVHRKALGAWLERVVFSTAVEHGVSPPQPHALPFACDDFRTQHVALSAANFHAALQASCSIPFVLRAVHDIAGAPPGAYWDGGITDYHLHLNYGAARSNMQHTPFAGSINPYFAINSIAAHADSVGASGYFDTQTATDHNLVLYPHFQQQVVPGWLDKSLRWRHRSSRFLDTTVLLAPAPEWVRSLPNGKLPDRTDFARYGADLSARVRDWSRAASASTQLADEFAAWLDKPDMRQVHPL